MCEITIIKQSCKTFFPDKNNFHMNAALIEKERNILIF